MFKKFLFAITFISIATTIDIAGYLYFAKQRPALAQTMDCAQNNIRCVGQNQEYVTIQACASVAMPGDVCWIDAGTYNEYITVINSGTAGSFVSFEVKGNVKVRGFRVDNRSYIRINGFEITNQNFLSDSLAAIYLEKSNNIEIINNHIHDTGSTYCIRMRDVDGHAKASNNNLIKNNIISHCSSLNISAPGIGINIFGNNNLIEGNDISHLGDDYMRVTGGDFNVIRNNTLHDNSLTDWNGSSAHIDGIQNWCNIGSLATRRFLIENNSVYETPSTDSHFVIYQDYGSCGNSEFIIRYNSIRNLGSYAQINDKRTSGVRLYNNNFINTGVAYSPKNTTAVEFSGSSLGGKLINNIFYNTVRDGYSVYNVDTSSLAGFNARNNLAYNTGYKGLWLSLIGAEVGAILNSDPLFLNSIDIALQSNSPAINKGSALTTTTNAGSNSISLSASDAGFFQSGWAGVNSDWIAVGSVDNAVQISSIDYASNIIMLSMPLSWITGDPVWLYKNSNNARVFYGTAPDIGAYEYIQASPPLKGDFNFDSKVNNLDFTSFKNAFKSIFNSIFDLNSDNTIDVKDLGVLMSGWLE